MNAITFLAIAALAFATAASAQTVYNIPHYPYASMFESIIFDGEYEELLTDGCTLWVRELPNGSWESEDVTITANWSPWIMWHGAAIGDTFEMYLDECTYPGGTSEQSPITTFRLVAADDVDANDGNRTMGQSDMNLLKSKWGCVSSDTTCWDAAAERADLIPNGGVGQQDLNALKDLWQWQKCALEFEEVWWTTFEWTIIEDPSTCAIEQWSFLFADTFQPAKPVPVWHTTASDD